MEKSPHIRLVYLNEEVSSQIFNFANLSNCANASTLSCCVCAIIEHNHNDSFTNQILHSLLLVFLKW